MRRAVAAAAAAVGVYATLIEPRRLVTTRLTLDVPSWPPTRNGYRVGFLSDLHAGAPFAGRKEIARAVERLNEQQPDVALLGGDYIDAHPIWGGRLAPELSAGVQRTSRRSELSLAYARTQSTLIGVVGTADTQSLVASSSFDVGRRVRVNSTSGGTDVVSAFAGGSGVGSGCTYGARFDTPNICAACSGGYARAKIAMSWNALWTRASSRCTSRSLIVSRLS